MPDERQEIADLIAALDERLGPEGASVEFCIYGGGPDESKMVGNLRGYQRLAIELLKATVYPGNKLNANISYLVSSDSEIQFHSFEVVDHAASAPPHAAGIGQRLLGIGCFLIALLVVGTMCLGFGIGAEAIIRWLWS